MQQLVFHAPGLLRWEALPDPEITSPGEALVRPVAVAASDLDAALMERKAPLAGPFPVGREFVADVIETGPAVTTVQPGQRISVSSQISCGACARCRSGLTGSCSAVRALSGYGLGAFGGLEWGGALSDVVRVPFADAMTLPLPESLDPVHLASLSHDLPEAHWAVAGVHAGDDVLIVGGRSVGLYAAAIAVGRGASVTYVDPDEARCRTASAVGAAAVNRRLDDRTEPRPRVIHTSADPAQLRHALLSTAEGGTCLDTGVYFTSGVELPLLEMYRTAVTFRTGRVPVRRHMPAVLSDIETGVFDPAVVTSRVARWEDAATAFAAAHTKLVVCRRSARP